MKKSNSCKPWGCVYIYTSNLINKKVIINTIKKIVTKA